MSFASRFGMSELKRDKFLSNEMYTALYDFLHEHNGLPDMPEEIHMGDCVGFNTPGRTDMFTAYKALLASMILTKLYPVPPNTYLTPTNAIHEMYGARDLKSPSGEEISAIAAEMNQIANGCAKTIIDEQMKKLRHEI